MLHAQIKDVMFTKTASSTTSVNFAVTAAATIGGKLMICYYCTFIAYKYIETNIFTPSV